MAFTFDDGPSPYNTVPILQTLAKYSIKATFYLIGVNVQAWPDIARRIANEGHELGNHSVYHSPYSSSALANQIGPNQLIIKEATGITPVTNRAPGLTKGQAILNACAEHNLYETHTHKDTNDWRSPRRSSPSLINEFKRYDWTGGIALYHDGGSYRPTAQALPIMIQSAIDKGYTFHTVTDLINSGSPRPINGLYPTLVSRQQEDIEESYIDICNYDVKRELGRRLLQLSNEAKKTNIPEINRLKELIGEIDTLEKN
jgi:peptidoglycan/xylan/chitin deacetylase (PgdA/CDA1 family)